MMSPMNLSQYYWSHWWLRGTCYYDPMAEYMDYMNQMREYEEALEGALLELPSAKSERKVGKWVPQDFNKRNGNTSTCVYYFPKCSVCGHVGDERFAFCPNCGADMRGEQDGH